MIKFDTDIFFKKMKNEIKEVIKEELDLLNKNDEVITEEEGSKLLRVSKRTLLQKRKDGELPDSIFFYVGRGVRYYRKGLLDYFSTQVS